LGCNGDHLGNVRLSYTDNNNDGVIQTDGANTEIIEESNYYPFGLKHKGYNNVTNSLGNSTAQKFGYNGTELNESLGLNLMEMDFRLYDPAIGRFNGIDPVTHFSQGTGVAFDNNPIIYADPSGADSKSFIMDLFENSASGTTFTNNNNGTFSGSDGTTVDCDECLKGGSYDGKSFNDIKEGFSFWTNIKTTKRSYGNYTASKFFKDDLDSYDEILDLLSQITVIGGSISGAVNVDLTNVKDIKIKKIRQLLKVIGSGKGGLLSSKVTSKISTGLSSKSGVLAAIMTTVGFRIMRLQGVVDQYQKVYDKYQAAHRIDPRGFKGIHRIDQVSFGSNGMGRNTAKNSTMITSSFYDVSSGKYLGSVYSTN